MASLLPALGEGGTQTSEILTLVRRQFGLIHVTLHKLFSQADLQFLEFLQRKKTILACHENSPFFLQKFPLMPRHGKWRELGPEEILTQWVSLQNHSR